MKIIIRENQLDLLNNGIITYHGGEYELTNENIKDEGLFTTPDKESAMWYVERADGWLTKMIVDIKNPLTIKNGNDFKKLWIPILDDTNIDYEFNDAGKHGWVFKSYDIIKHDGSGEYNIFDLIYIDEFVDSAKKHGYDGIVGWDVMFNYDIPIYIPFYRKNINIIDSVKLGDEKNIDSL